MSADAADVLGLRGRAGSDPREAPSTNPLVVGPIDTTTPFSGTRLLEDGHQIKQALENKDWVSGSLAAAAGGADLIAAAMDPIGTTISMGVGWILDHVDPLKSWLNDLTGDAGAVAGGAGTWANISAHLEACAQGLHDSLDATLADQRSEAVDAYKRLQSDQVQHLSMVAGLSGGISSGLTVASTLVQVVHDLVRDAIADIVGKFASAALQAVVTVGLATPKIIMDIVATVNKWATRLGSKVRALVESFDSLGALMRKVDGLMADVARIMDRLAAPSRKATELGEAFGRGARNATRNADEFGDILSKWVTPRYTDDALRGLPTARQEAADFLSMPDTIDEFRARGMTPWTVDDLMDKAQIRVDDPRLTSADKQMLHHVREHVAQVGDGTLISKLHLQQSAPLPQYSDVSGFTARSQDLQGLSSADRFRAVRGDYGLDGDLATHTPTTTWNSYTETTPLYETRVRADSEMVARTHPAYSSDMLDQTGTPIGSKSPVGTSAFGQNQGDPTGPYTGNGFPTADNGTLVPKNHTARPTPGSDARYQETYDTGTGSRTSIVVHNPFSAAPDDVVRIPTFR